MARERRYGSAAEKQAAWRARKRAMRGAQLGGTALTDVSIPVSVPARVVEEVSKQVGELLEWEGRLLPIERGTPMSEEDYVRWSVGSIPSTMATPERIERASRYARWRWRGFRVGKVNSLV